MCTLIWSSERRKALHRTVLRLSAALFYVKDYWSECRVFVAGRSDSVWSRREEETKIESIWWRYGVVAAVFLQDSDLIIVTIVVGFFFFLSAVHLDWLKLVCGKAGKSVCFTVQRILLSLDFCNRKNLVQFRKIASNWSSKSFLSIEESCDINVSACCDVVAAVFL